MTESSDQPPFPTSSRHSLDDDLLRTSPQPPDLLLSDLTPVPHKEPRKTPRSMPPPAFGVSTRDIGKSRPAGQSALLSRAGFPTTPTSSSSHSTSSPSSLTRSSTLPTLSPARTTNHTVHGQTYTRTTSRLTPAATLPPNQGTIPKSKGVQMISALRSRVQTTQQRLIPGGIPRLRMGSVTTRPNPVIPLNATPSSSRRGSVSTDGRSSRAGRRLSTDDRGTRPSEESQRETERSAGAQSPGWVLIQTQDDSPFRSTIRPESAKEQRRASNPVLLPTTTSTTSTTNGQLTVPSSFKPLSSTSRIPTGVTPRRPQSRFSLTGSERSSPTPAGGGLSASSSIPSLSAGRPATPTFLPVPTFNQQGPGGKRSYQPNRRANV